MQIALRKRDLDSSSSEAFQDLRVQVMPSGQPLIEVGQVESRLQVERAVSELFKVRGRWWLVQNVGVTRTDFA